MKGRRNPNLTRVRLLVPKAFLQRFDTAIQGLFPSRSEAIRRGMNLIVQEVRRSKHEPPPSTPQNSKMDPQDFEGVKAIEAKEVRVSG